MNHIEKTIDELKKQVLKKEKELIETKQAVNQLCSLINQPPIYIISQPDREQLATHLKGDEYYMQPFASVITKILERRKMLGSGPAGIREIYEEMIAGGFKFEVKNEQNAIRGIRVSISKNTAKFHKLPSGKFGLREWYPELKEGVEPINDKAEKKKVVKRKKRKKPLQSTILMADIITKVLEKRKVEGLEPATLEEIYKEMKDSGHQFTGKTDSSSMRGLSIAMGKNRQIFRKSSNGKWSLVEKE